MYCVHCGEKINSSNTYCIHCGIKINNKNEVVNKNASGLKITSIIFGSLSIVGALMFFFLHFV